MKFSRNTFEGQRSGEQVVLWIEKHWVKYFRALSLLVIGGLIPALIVYTVTFLFVKNMTVVHGILTFLYVYEIFILWYVFVELMNDELDLFIITNERIVDITQVSLLERKIADTPLEKIQDVAAECKGFLPTVLNFGTVRVQTAGKTSEFQMSLVPDPFGKSKKILELINIQKNLGPQKSI